MHMRARSFYIKQDVDPFNTRLGVYALEHNMLKSLAVVIILT